MERILRFDFKMAVSSMYTMKPFYENFNPIEEYPTRIYKIKSFHEDLVDDLGIDCSEFRDLRKRQEVVLHELEKLQNEVDQISHDIGMRTIKGETVKPKDARDDHSSTTAFSNIVIKASPEDPPLSVYLLHMLALQQGVDISMLSYIHSSCTAGPNSDNLSKLFHTSSGKGSMICLGFIWKSDIFAPSLMASVATQSPILGEANILRCLSRMFLPHLYNGNQPVLVAIIDEWLQVAAKLSSPKETKPFIQNLNSCLEKQNWLAGNIPTIADMYCSLALIKTCQAGQFSRSISTWIANCRKEFQGFDEVEKLCK